MENMTLVPTDAPVDPTLFAVNWDVTFEVLVMIVVLAFFMERALAVLFKSDSAYRRAQAAAKQAAAETAPAESELVLGRVVALERAVAEIAETSLDRQTGQLRESGRTASEKHD